MQDKSVMFGIAEDLTDATQHNSGNTGTTYLTNWYDTAAQGSPKPAGPGGTIGGPLLHDIGRGGNRLKVDAQIVTAVTSGGAATVELDLVSAPDNAGAVNTGSATILLKSDAVAKATLVVGYRYRFSTIAREAGAQTTSAATYPRYLGMSVVIGSNQLTAGAVTAGMQLDVEDHADIFG